MVKKPRVLCLTLLGVISLSAQQSSLLAIRHVSVIDGTGAPARADQTVVVSGNRISAIGAEGSVRVPNSAQIIDGRGRYLIPGVWDMHIHIRGSRLPGQASFARENEAVLPLYLANGITGVREMGGDMVDTVLKWRDEIAQGRRQGPRIVTSGPKLDGSNPIWPGSIPISTAEEAKAAVARVKNSGADFIKVYNSKPNIPRDALLVILAEGKRLGMRVTGHLSEDVPYSEAAAAGQDFEHIQFILRACSGTVKETSLPTGFPSAQEMETITGTFDPRVAKDLVDGFVRHRTWVTPTLNIMYHQYLGTSDAALDPRAKYIPPRMLASWTDRARSQPPSAVQAPFPLELRRAYYRRGQELLRIMREAGVLLLAGSDTGTSNPSYPGFSLHDELARLTEAGLPPMEVLRMATWNAAKWTGSLSTLGSIGNGKLADLVLLDADPLADIRNTERIRAVIVNGKLLDRPQLDNMLRGVELAH